jgi:ribosomal protein L11 methyltransferase
VIWSEARSPKPKAWPALAVQLPTPIDPTLIELLLARLDDFQPTAIHESDERALRVFFATCLDRDAALDAVTSAFSGQGLSGHPLDVDDENWAVRSQAELRAVQVGRLVVAPPWDVQTDAPPGFTTIVIEPSMGFGTGHHASTRLCLETLQKLDLRGRHVLDIGTGSGVLAVAAVLLGAAQALAVDVDADALESARQNATRNGVDHAISFLQADFRNAALPAADIVLANLTGAIVNTTFERLVELAVSSGVLVLSGFTQDELIGRPDGPAAASPRVEIIDRLDEEGWRCLVLRRKE